MAKDLSYYKRQRNQVWNQINQRKEKNKALQAEISKLDTAYKKLEDLKKEAEAVQKNLKTNNMTKGLQWKGRGRSNFDKKLDGDIKNKARLFVKSIDNMMDRINSEKRRKEGQYDTGITVLNSLNRSYKSIVSTIQNLIN